MAKAEWGLKRICPHCGTRYYDMKKKPPVCPSCGTVLELDTLAKSRRARAPIEEKVIKPKPVSEDDLEGIEVEVEADDSDDDSLIEDADELGEDDLSVEDVIEIGADEKDDI